MLTLKHINKSYGNRTILSDISLSIRKGEIVSILGPSGCGKTTLLNLILGLTQATSGKIMFDGEDPHECARCKSAASTSCSRTLRCSRT